MTKRSVGTAVDVDRLLRDLEGGARRARELSDKLHREPALEPGAGAGLIEDTARNLAQMRVAAGLPSRDASAFAERIKLRRRDIELP